MNRKRKIRWRHWLRSLHRDVGYLAVGLTFVYAMSGLAVNHISDWDPNFRDFEKTHQLSGPVEVPKAVALPSAAGEGPAWTAARKVLVELDRDEPPRDAYLATETELEIVLDDATLHVDLPRGRVIEEGQKERFLLRAANWLHLNRGKKAWTYIADGYAAFLLFLATSGLFMLPGKGRFIGRRGVLVMAGALVPIAYVVLSGGP